MTIKTETTERTVKETHTRVLSITCDICGRVEDRAEEHHGDGIDWTGGRDYHHEVVTCTYESSNRWPNGEGSGSKTALDICPECFNEHILPLVKGKQRHRDIDY